MMVANALPNQIVPFNVAASIESVKQLSEIVSVLREQVFRSGHDFGIIPGTTKPTLLLPGMEKLMRALRLRAEYHAVSMTEDFDKGLFAYRYECRLIEFDTGLCVATAIGSCNSKESKYRWRDQKRVCPVCGVNAIMENKPDKGPGFYCWKKMEGCGANFGEKHPEYAALKAQPMGRIENPDIFDQVNTIDKMSQKRALGSAIKGAANVSEHFTVDLEHLYRFDDVVEAEYTEVVEPPTIVDKATGEITDAPLVDQPQPKPQRRVDTVPGTPQNGKSESLFQHLMKAVTHMRYSDSTARANAINRLLSADILHDKMDRGVALKLVNAYADMRDGEIEQAEAIAAVRKLAAAN